MVPEAWGEVRSLLRRIPLGGELPVVIERGEDAARAYPSLGGDSFALLARVGESVAGYVHGRVELRRVFRQDALVPQELLLFEDLRVDTRFRRSGIARALLDGLAEEAVSRG